MLSILEALEEIAKEINTSIMFPVKAIILLCRKMLITPRYVLLSSDRTAVKMIEHFESAVLEVVAYFYSLPHAEREKGVTAEIQRYSSHFTFSELLCGSSRELDSISTESAIMPLCYRKVHHRNKNKIKKRLLINSL